MILLLIMIFLLALHSDKIRSRSKRSAVPALTL